MQKFKVNRETHVRSYSELQKAELDKIMHNINDFITFLFSNTQGYTQFCALKKGKPCIEKTIDARKKNELDYLLRKQMLQYFDDYNIYYSTCTLKNRYSRKTENIKQLCLLFTDIDFKGKDINTFDEVQELIDLLTRDLFDTKILPMPNVFVRSGRGLQLIWKISPGPISIKMKYLWELTQVGIAEKIQSYLDEYDSGFRLPFKVDLPVSKDATRLLRLPYTVNKKNGAFVHWDKVHQIQYELLSICHTYFDGHYDIPKKEYKKFAPKKAKSTTAKCCAKPMHYRPMLALMEDLNTLAIGATNRRRRMVFLYSQALIKSNYTNPLDELTRFNQLFGAPLPYKEMFSIFVSSKKRQYKLSSNYVAELLEIYSKAERAQFRFIATSEQKSTRKKAEDYACGRLDPEDTFTIKQTENMKRDKHIIELYKSGYSIRKIADTVGLGKSRVHQIIHTQLSELELAV